MKTKISSLLILFLLGLITPAHARVPQKTKALPRTLATAKTSSISTVQQLLQQAYDVWAVHNLEKKSLEAQALKVRKIVEQLKDPDQLALLCIESANINRAANQQADFTWVDCSEMLYNFSLDELAKQHSVPAQRAMRHIAEALRGDNFHTHMSDVWIQAAMKQNGETDDSKSGWYIEKYLIQRYNGSSVRLIEHLQAQARIDIDQKTKIPENIAPSSPANNSQTAKFKPSDDRK